MQNPEQETGRLGETRRAISRSIVTVLKEHLGRGPVKAKTYLHEDSVLVLMFNGHTVAEETLGAEGEEESVASQRVKASKASKTGLPRLGRPFHVGPWATSGGVVAPPTSRGIKTRKG